MAAAPANRLQTLEGLRGIAAIMVVVFHALLLFWPLMFYGPEAGRVSSAFFEDNIYGTPLGVLTSGPFAVAIFFVISGFVLSVGFFETGDRNIIRKLAAKRYLRLMLPALASVLIVWLVMSARLSSLDASLEAANNNANPLSLVWNFPPDLLNAVREGAWGAFVTGDVSYNRVLWTMFFEFAGSFLIFGACLLFGRISRRWVIYLALALITWQTWFLAFVVGMVLADLYVQKKLVLRSWAAKIGMIGLLSVGLFLGGHPEGTASTKWYDWLHMPGLSPSTEHNLYFVVGASLVTLAIFTLAPLSKFFARPSIAKLGKYTFALYLIHLPILFTLCASLFVWLTGLGLGINKAGIISIALTTPVIVMTTVFFQRYVDAPSIKLSGIFANWLLATKGSQKGQSD